MERRQMITPFCRVRCLFVVAVITCGCTAGIASAQAPDDSSIGTASFSAVRGHVPVGDVVYVTDTTGVTIRGKLAALTDDAVQVNIGADVRSVAADQVRRIQWQQPDSPLTGVLIGAAVGAVPGIYWLVVDPNECTGMCAEEYVLVAIGALVGGVIDHVIKRKVTVYAAGVSSGRAKSITIGPLVMRNRKGVRVAVRF
jgi:hypothetical protein